jgi:cell division protein FtsI/penicillin-binding protein 2
METMLRRRAIAVFLGAATARAGRARLNIDSIVESPSGAALLVDLRSREIVAVHNPTVAGRLAAPPGSTLKPFALVTLLLRDKLTASERYFCPGKLTIAGRSLNCSHPGIDIPMTVETALAYSCNCFAAHAAERFGAGELSAGLNEFGLGDRTGLFASEANGRIVPASGVDACRLQALGEDGVSVTLAELAMGYRNLANRLRRPEMQSIAAGLRGAVAYGTAQRAAVSGMHVAGKTGSVRTAEGARVAWFAGYAPADAPEVVVAVMLQARSGGSDAAPVASRILEAWAKSR